MSAAHVGRALAAFDSDPADNPGRMNLFRVGRGHVLVDYGHNPAAFEAIAALAAHWPDRRTTAVFTVPGDRDDELIREGGRVVARGFDRIIIREDADLRGRQPGEVSRLLCEAAHEADAHVECRSVLDERDAVRAALDGIADDEVMIAFYEDFAAVMEVLTEYGAVPVTTLPARTLAAV